MHVFHLACHYIIGDVNPGGLVFLFIFEAKAKTTSKKEKIYSFGFAKVIGVCNVIEAELWGIYEGQIMAWSLYIPRKLIAKMLSMLLLPHIFDLIDRQWSVRICWMNCKGNADGKACLAYGRYVQAIFGGGGLSGGAAP
ncbi:hypothetical protein V6N13_099724 [Hibiscus sabdariffa]|uniref:Uncharacterized protein n=1 Tax=Hibiscus sabdariffa TaxID=183260 RepID=A0ABR2NM45_9ROSI